MALPIFESERLRLRDFHIADAKSLFEVTQKDNVTKYLLWESHTSLLGYVSRFEALCDFARRLRKLLAHENEVNQNRKVGFI